MITCTNFVQRVNFNSRLASSSTKTLDNIISARGIRRMHPTLKHLLAQNMRVKMLLQMLMAFAHMRTSLVGLANKGRRTQHPSILEQTMGSTVASPICG